LTHFFKGRHGKGKEKEAVDPDLAYERFHLASVPVVRLSAFSFDRFLVLNLVES